MRVEKNQNSLFLVGPVIKGFVILPNSKVEQTAKTTFDAAWHTNFRGFKVIMTRSRASRKFKLFCFPRELVGFVRLRELVSFDP